MMKDLKLIITLLSDMCPGSGDSYNTRVDTDVVYDRYGIPYIPSKRIKGCIRESYREFSDLGVKGFDESGLVQIFGANGAYSRSNLVLSSARLPQLNEIRKALKGSTWLPQDVLDVYAYTRTQTSIDAKTGTAEENHLRVKRVIKKGLTFESKVSIEEDYVDAFCKAAKNVVHMGLNRTRGLGLVKVECVKDDESVTPTIEQGIEKAANGKYIIQYKFSLKSPVLCKSPEGNQTRTQPYIDGNKMLGLLAETLNRKKDAVSFCNLMDQEPVFAAAYISAEGLRAVPASVSMRKKKNDSFDENGNLTVFDYIVHNRADDEDSGVEKSKEEREIPDQFSSVGDIYISETNNVCSVDTEISYHHQRPEDASIGHATGDNNDGSSFYQLESISEEQEFIGYIKCNETAKDTILQTAKEIRNPRIGYAKNTEFGEVEVYFYAPEPETTKNLKSGSEYIIKIHTPIILYNNEGMYSSDKGVFKDYLAKALGVATEKIDIVNSVLTYETVGGFNVTQKKRKPIITAIGRGSIFRIRVGDNCEIDAHTFIGERVSEGYGEIAISLPSSKESIILHKVDNTVCVNNQNDEVKGEAKKLLDKLEKNLNEKRQRRKARDMAKTALKDLNEKHYSADALAAAVTKMILVYRDVIDRTNLYNGIKAGVRGGKTHEDEKERTALAVLKKTENWSKKNPDAYDRFMKTYLTEWKILLRNQ